MGTKGRNEKIASVISDILILHGVDKETVELVKNWDFSATDYDMLGELKAVAANKAKELHKRISIFPRMVK